MAAIAERPQVTASEIEAPPGVSTSGRQETNPEQPYIFRASHVYASNMDATMVRNALAVDPELRPKQVTKVLTVEGRTLVICYSATDARTLRAAVGGLYDLLGLATRTLEAFGSESGQEQEEDGAAHNGHEHNGLAEAVAAD